MELEKLLTDKDLEEKSIAGVQTLKKWRREGRGPRFLRIGHKIRYRASDVAEWLESRAEGGERKQAEGGQ